MKTIGEITKLVSAVFVDVPDVFAVVLMGSCSRGEETWRTTEDGNKELMSDYEFTIFLNNMIPRTISLLNNRLTMLNSRLKLTTSSPFFRLEWNYFHVKKVPFIDKRFINFEMKTANYLIYGNSTIFKLLPNISIKNINYSELMSIINHRLYHVLKDVHLSDEHEKKYLIARNTLDIPSIVLPLEGDLVCSYKKRISTFIDKKYDTIFENDLGSRLSSYYLMKTDYSSELYCEVAVNEMLNLFIKDMMKLHDYMCRKHHGKPFIVDKRRLLKACLKCNIRQIAYIINRPNEEEALYQYMLAKLQSCQVTNG